MTTTTDRLIGLLKLAGVRSPRLEHGACFLVGIRLAMEHPEYAAMLTQQFQQDADPKPWADAGQDLRAFVEAMPYEEANLGGRR